MGFQDEEIIKKKKDLEQQKKLRESQDRLEKEAEESIYDEIVHIIGEEVHFQRREIPDLKISIYMPETFFLFTDDVKHLVYPGANAPTHVFGGENINFQMSFHQTEHIVPDDGMKKFMDITADLMKAVGPRVTIIEKKVLEKEDFHIGVLQFVSRAIDMMVYNFQYYISMEDDRLLIGGITFPSKYKKRFFPLAKEMIDSICKLKEEV